MFRMGDGNNERCLFVPEYSKSDITYEITRDKLLQMTGATHRKKEQFLACVLWMTGARPSELIELKKEDVTISATKLVFKVVTKKKRKGRWHLVHRELEFSRPIPPNPDKVIEFVANYINKSPEGRLFLMTVRTVEYIIERMGRKGLRKFVCPYNFRHSRMSLLARQGRTIDELMHFKGSSDMRSVATYLHAKPFKVDL